MLGLEERGGNRRPQRAWHKQRLPRRADMSCSLYQGKQLYANIEAYRKERK